MDTLDIDDVPQDLTEFLILADAPAPKETAGQIPGQAGLFPAIRRERHTLPVTR